MDEMCTKIKMHFNFTRKPEVFSILLQNLGGGGGSTLIFTAYVSLDPASTVYPIKISEQQVFPNKYVIES